MLAKTIFYGSLAGGRLVALIIANVLAPQLMLIMSMIFCVVGGAALWVFGPYYIEALEVMIIICVIISNNCGAAWQINSRLK